MIADHGDWNPLHLIERFNQSSDRKSHLVSLLSSIISACLLSQIIINFHTIMDAKQQQRDKLLDAIHDDSTYESHNPLTEYRNYDQDATTSRRWKFLGSKPWVLHLAIFFCYTTFFVALKFSSREKNIWPSKSLLKFIVELC